MKLSQIVRIAPQFQRAVRVDLDFGKPAALAGYVFQSSARSAIEAVITHVRDSGTCAFTLTGPYGGGKSYLALLLASRLAGERASKEAARQKLGSKADAELGGAFKNNGKRWEYLPVVGSRQDLTAAIWEELKRRGLIKKKGARSSKGVSLPDRLIEIASRPGSGGLLIVVDELGKHLESAARDESDIYVLQQIAEAANRSNRRLVFVGILHQAFDQYASRLGREAKDEWAKIQGRFTDIPVLVPVDEVVELVGRAIVCERGVHAHRKQAAVRIAEEIRRNRPGYNEDLWQRLDRCWPLDPATTALLGPVSRRRFSQNERSVFSFLGSAEPLGFSEFIKSVDVSDNATFTLSRYWEYLRANLEPSILSSPDGHRWAQAAEAVSRAEAKGSVAHINITKTIALIDLFKNGSGLNATTDVIVNCLHGLSDSEAGTALQELKQWGVVAHRKHNNAWVIHEGSDFDIDAGVNSVLAAGVDFELHKIAGLANLQPVLAKRLYHKSGTLRWFFTELCWLHDVERVAREFDGHEGAAGKFLLAIPERDVSWRAARQIAQGASKSSKLYPVAIAVAAGGDQLRDVGLELLALEALERRYPEIEGDRVARREISARIASVSAVLEDELRTAFVASDWYVKGTLYKITSDFSLSQLASDLGAACFSKAPKINSELVNRQKPSSNSQAAVRQLLWAMVSKPASPNLGLEGFSAERGLYETVLHSTGLHGKRKDGAAGFNKPSGNDECGLGPLWEAADSLVQACEVVTFAELYERWEEPPFGVRKGLLPILGLAYVLSNTSAISVYREGMYQPDVNEVFADTLLQDPKLVGMRWFKNDGQQKKILESIVEVVRSTISPNVESEALAVSKSLVRFALGLPKWTQRTAQLTNGGANLMRLLLKSSDPNRLLFVDLPAALSPGEAEGLSAALVKCLHELSDVYPSVLAGIRGKLLDALRVDQRVSLKERAETVHGISGDLVLDAFALRVGSLDDGAGDIEGLISLVTNRPPREWTDRDIDIATIELARLAMRFRQVELLASVKGRSSSREAVAVAVALPNGESARLRAVDLSKEERRSVQRMAADLRKFLLERSKDTDLCIAAMAEAAFTLVEATENERE
jgi:hypothetical protein